MEATELRIGNLYVNYEDKICSWGCDDFAMLWKNQGLEVDELIRNFIPLTDEWLLKFGFICWDDYNNRIRWYDPSSNQKTTRSGNKCEPKEEMCIIDFDRKTNLYYYRSKRLKISFVHQLQNFYFALTGNELKLQS